MAVPELVSSLNHVSKTANPRAGNSSHRNRGIVPVAVMPSSGSTQLATIEAASSLPAWRSCAVNSATAVSIHAAAGSDTRSASDRSTAGASPISSPSSTSPTSGGAVTPFTATMPRTPRKRSPCTPKPPAIVTSAAMRIGAASVANSGIVPLGAVVPLVLNSGMCTQIPTVTSPSVVSIRQPSPTWKRPALLLTTRYNPVGKPAVSRMGIQ